MITCCVCLKYACIIEEHETVVAHASKNADACVVKLFDMFSILFQMVSVEFTKPESPKSTNVHDYQGVNFD